MSSLQKNLSNYKFSNVPDGEGLKFAIIVSEWNSEITENLYKGTRVTLFKLFSCKCYTYFRKFMEFLDIWK